MTDQNQFDRIDPEVLEVVQAANARLESCTRLATQRTRFSRSAIRGVAAWDTTPARWPDDCDIAAVNRRMLRSVINALAHDQTRIGSDTRQKAATLLRTKYPEGA